MITCKNCRAQLDDSDRTCRYCGAPVNTEIPVARPVQPPQSPAAPYHGSAGYSTLIDSDEVVRALKKNSRIGAIAVIVFVLLPFVGFLIWGKVSDKMDVGQAAVFGLIISAVFAFAAAVVALKKKLAKPFEGTVADKKIRRKLRNSYDHAGVSRTKYIVVIQCEDGKRRKKEVPIPTYEYLNVGDRVRYLPQFPQPFEKYDKRADSDVMCLFCGRRNPLSETTCSFCHNPLIK